MKNFKKILSVAVIFTLLFTVTASAAVMDFTVGSTTTNSYNGETLTTNTLDAAPFVNSSDRTMVPVRAISENFGAEVGWDEPTQTVTVTNGDTVLTLVIGSNTATVNGKEITLDSVPTLVNGRTFVPLRFIGEALGYNINYCNTTEQIIIDDTPLVAMCGNHVVTFAEFEALYGIIYNVNHDTLLSKGYSEADIKTTLVQYTLEEISNVVYVLNTFAEATLSDEHKAEILLAVENEKSKFATPMLSLVTLIEEKVYLSTFVPAIDYYANQPETLELVKDYVQAKHILVEDEATAKLVYEKAIAGEDFDTLISQYNTDPGMTKNPEGYIFTYGEMVEPFEKAAFALGYGEISQPVKSDFGYHIIKRSDDNSGIKRNIAVGNLATILINAETATPLMTVAELSEMIK